MMNNGCVAPPRGKKRYGVQLIGATAIGIALFCGTAYGQQSLGKMLEPTRFALVIGNATYGDHGNLPSLGSPCAEDEQDESDASVVRDALVATGWKVDYYCNQTTDQLAMRIRHFNDKVRKEPRAFGIIYFSGHGAEIAGTNYLFGIDATVHEATEVQTFHQNPYALLFGGAAVPLDETMRQVQPLWGKAVLVFIDACRTNPILEGLRKAGLSLLQYPSRASEPVNVLYSFSTSAGAPSPDGGKGNVSRFTRAIADVIRAQKNAQPEEVDLLVGTITGKVFSASNRQQAPGRAGNIVRPPKFCILGCPTLEEEWKSFYDEFEKQRPMAPATAFAAPRLWRTSTRGVTVAQAEPVAPPPMQQAKPSLEATDSSIRKVRVDVLYCSGDRATEHRRLVSEQIRNQLKGLTGSRSLVQGFEVGEVRVIGVPPAVNQSLYKATDSVLSFNGDSPAQRLWAESLQSTLTPHLRIEEKPGSASDYMSILVCDNAIQTDRGPTIYLQASRNEQVGKASVLAAELAQRLPGAKVADGVEVVAKSPNQTEVRYFTLADAPDATAVARETEDLLNRKVAARFVPGYEAKLNGTRLIEIWIGKKDSP